MAWLVGIDEAGYGPNLGPLVVSAVAYEVPDADWETNLWESLRLAVRSPCDTPDDRILVADSKVVYSPALGLVPLELGVLSLLAATGLGLPDRNLLNWISASVLDELALEPWFDGEMAAPTESPLESCASSRELLHQAASACGLRFGPMRSHVVCPKRFNRIANHFDSKAAVLGEAFHALTKSILSELEDPEEVYFCVDKHGGRNRYAAMIQEAFPDSLVCTREESANRSEYAVRHGDLAIAIRFEPRADAAHFPVAVASMLSKYVRERCMLQFNAYWRTHLPDIRPTAGYPGDAKRFFAEIRHLLPAVGLGESQVWRDR